MVNARQLLRYAGRAPELFQALEATPAVVPLVARYLQLGTPTYPVRIPLRGGGWLTLSSLNEVKVFWQIAVHRSYALPEDCASILDCGANIGIFSIWAARQRPRARIVAVEPCTETFHALQAHVRQNGLESRIQPLQMGLAATPGERYIETTGASPDRKLMPADASIPHALTEPVKCMTLEGLLHMLGMDSLDLLKMDIEGSEWEVLLSTSPEVLARIRHIQLEYHEVHARFQHTPEKLFAHLARGGHRLVFRTQDHFSTGLAFFDRATGGNAETSSPINRIRRSAEVAP